MNRRKIINDSVRYLAATVIAQGVGLLRSIFLPILLLPAQLGVWNFMTVVVGYGTNAHFGLLHGMNKAIPTMRGKGNDEHIGMMKDSVFWLNLLLGLLAGMGVWVVSIFIDKTYAVPLRYIGVVIVLQMPYYYYYSLLRADNRFSLVSKGVAGFTILSSVLVVCMALLFSDHLHGALFGLILANAVAVIYWFIKSKYNFVLKIDLSMIKRSLVLGVPLIIIGMIDSLFLSIDRWIIASRLDATLLGYYALSIMVCNVISLIPVSVSSVVYPRILERIAESGDVHAGKNMLLRPLWVLLVIVAVMIVCVYFAIPYLIQFALPKYLHSIPLIRILVMSALFLSIAPFSGNYLIAVDKQRWLIYVQVAAAIFVVIVANVLLNLGYGLVGVAYAAAGGYVIYGLGYTVLAVSYAIRKRYDVLKYILRLVVMFVTILFSTSLASFLISDADSAMWAGISCAGRILLASSMVLFVSSLLNREDNPLVLMLSELRMRYAQT